jgi:hypothetical protein
VPAIDVVRDQKRMVVRADIPVPGLDCRLHAFDSGDEKR